MKRFCIFLMLTACCFCRAEAQRYVLIDQTLARPMRFTESISQKDILDQWFPVETKHLHEFQMGLSRIYNQLKKNHPAAALNEKMGCSAIQGTIVNVMNERRYSYTLQFNCDKVTASYLLCDTRLKNPTNAFIVSTWMKYTGKKK